MKNNFAVYFGLLMIFVGLVLAYFRHSLIEVPFAPNLKVKSWEVELTIYAKSKGKKQKISVFNPTIHNRLSIKSQSFTTDSYELSSARINDTSKVIFTKGDTVSNLDQEFKIRFIVEDLSNSKITNFESNIKDKFSKSQKKLLKNYRTNLINSVKREDATAVLVSALLYKKDLDFIKTKDDIENALTYLGFPSKFYYGSYLYRGKKRNEFNQYLFLNDGGKKRIYSPRSKKFINSLKVFLWEEASSPIDTVQGLDELKWTFVAIPLKADLQKVDVTKTSLIAKFLYWFSINRLDLSTQNSFGILLLLPFATLVVAVLRNVVGIKTFGTFMPAIIALSFKDTGLKTGLMLFVIVIIVGVMLRVLFTYFRLLLVPRLSSTLTCVVLLLFCLSLFGKDFAIKEFSSLAIFPVVILAMVIERLSVSIDELGILSAFNTLLLSLIAASISYLIITEHYISYLLVMFPELNFVVLGLAIILGRYFGYRATELLRFKNFGDA